MVTPPSYTFVFGKFHRTRGHHGEETVVSSTAKFANADALLVYDGRWSTNANSRRSDRQVEKLLGDFGHSFVLWSTVAVSPPSSVPTLRHAYDPGQGILPLKINDH